MPPGLHKPAVQRLLHQRVCQGVWPPSPGSASRPPASPVVPVSRAGGLSPPTSAGHAGR